MLKSVSVIDYGCGNMLSIVRALIACNVNVETISTPEGIVNSDRIILPGVGAFGKCMEELNKRNLHGSILEYIKKGNPLLGICVGMQILYDFGEEFGHHKGLSIIPGKVCQIPARHAGGIHKIPFVGWAKIKSPHNPNKWDSPIFSDIPVNSFFYFVHSFMGIPEDDKHCLAIYDYNGVQVPAIVGHNNIIGCQFHPEKSGKIGLTLLNNFLVF